MKTTYTIDEQLASVVFYDAASLETAISIVEALFSDAMYRAGMPILVDLTPSEVEWNWKESDFWNFVAAIREHAGSHDLRFAMVVETPRGFGEGRMVESIAEGHGIEARVFYNAADATAWLLG